MKIRHLFAFIILTIVFLTACNPSMISPDDNWQKHDNQELGISFELPAAWVTQEGDNVISIATNQAALDSGINTDAGASITLATAEDFDGYNDPSDILGLFMDYFERGNSGIVKLEEAKTATIQGQPAATVAYQGKVRDLDGQFRVMVVSNNDKIALVFTVDSSENGEYQDILERFSQSISLQQ